jgi:hypothetical protein
MERADASASVARSEERGMDRKEAVFMMGCSPVFFSAQGD